MWKREQAYFVGLRAASNVIWAEAGKRLFSLSELCRNRRGVLGNPTDPPHSHTGDGSRYHRASQLAVAASPTGYLSEVSPCPGLAFEVTPSVDS